MPCIAEPAHRAELSPPVSLKHHHPTLDSSSYAHMNSASTYQRLVIMVLPRPVWEVFSAPYKADATRLRTGPHKYLEPDEPYKEYHVS